MSEDKSQQLPEMSLWEHVDALRSVLIKMAVTVLVAAIGFFIVMPTLFDHVILAPCKGDFILYQVFESITKSISFLPDFSTQGFNVELINIQLASQFFTHMSTSFWFAVVFTFPILLYFLWTFVRPALYQNEKKGIKRAFFIGNLMFFLGVAVGYFVVFPITLRFLSQYHVSELIPNQISLDSYMHTFLLLIFIMGIVFELPMLAWLLGKLGVVHREFFKRYRRHAIVVLLILAALITPTGDPFTLMVVFLPIYLLWEASSWFVKPAPVDDDAEAAE
ncbi:MAG: twin-arginine translocase subunit TatC [Muribaculaceae bacterium]|nr:twin-arginine translocase subunit TatC [Muribaculaceae bacterium]